MIHPYCIRRAGEPGPSAEVRGVTGAPVVLLEHNGLGVWHSTCGEVHPTPENLARHDRVVRAALATGTPLPLRFGMRIAEVDGLERTLREQRDEYLRLLDRVEGCVEIGLRLPLADRHGSGGAKDDRGAETGGEGGRYMRRLRTEHERQRLRRGAAERSLAPVLAALPAPVEVAREVVDGSVVVVSLLVRKPDVPSFRDAFPAAREAVEGPLSMTGPWPPYSFTRVGPDER